jgi:hypothetical protein
MVLENRPFTDLLVKEIDLTKAPARGFRAALALPPDDGDQRAYAQAELRARWKALDEFFGLSSKALDIWEQRARALLVRRFSAKQWEGLARQLVLGYVPGFSFGTKGKKVRGAPRVWTDQRLAQLFADVEFLKRTQQVSVRVICQKLPRAPGYARRWGDCKPAGLRVAYSKAAKLSRGLLFQFVLCGVEATIPASGIDHIEAAIRLHALKRPL